MHELDEFTGTESGEQLTLVDVASLVGVAKFTVTLMDTFAGATVRFDADVLGATVKLYGELPDEPAGAVPQGDRSRARRGAHEGHSPNP